MLMFMVQEGDFDRQRKQKQDSVGTKDLLYELCEVKGVFEGKQHSKKKINGNGCTFSAKPSQHFEKVLGNQAQTTAKYSEKLPV